MDSEKTTDSKKKKKSWTKRTMLKELPLQTQGYIVKPQ